MRQGNRKTRRGVAMLMVMIALVVCLVLVTGYLAAQGTANGIARNENEYARAQRAAETGANMCLALIRARSDWRSAMSPGTWLNNAAVGDGFVTVTAADASGMGNFLADPTKAVVFTATGTYNGRQAKLVATAQPTGGGTVFFGGSFSESQIRLDRSAYVDSFNSANGSYSLLNAGANAVLSTACSESGSILIQDSATLLGSVQVGVTQQLTNVVSLALGATGPTGTSAAAETRTAGEVIPPNTKGLANRVTTNYSGNGTAGPTSGVYSQLNINLGALGTSINQGSAVVRVTGNMSVASSAKINVANNANVVYYVDGNVTYNGNMTIGSGANVTIYVGGTFVATGAQMNYALLNSGTPSSLTILGLKNNAAFTIKGGANVSAAIFAPQAAIELRDTAQVYGGVVGRALLLTDSAKLHWDTALSRKVLNNVDKGSAPPGTAVYRVSYDWNPAAQ